MCILWSCFEVELVESYSNLTRIMHAVPMLTFCIADSGARTLFVFPPCELFHSVSLIVTSCIRFVRFYPCDWISPAYPVLSSS